MFLLLLLLLCCCYVFSYFFGSLELKFDNDKAKAKWREEAGAEGQTEWTGTERKQRERQTDRQAGRQFQQVKSWGRKNSFILCLEAEHKQQHKKEGEEESLLFSVAAGPFNVAGDMSKVFLRLSTVVIVVVMFVI